MVVVEVDAVGIEDLLNSLVGFETTSTRKVEARAVVVSVETTSIVILEGRAVVVFVETMSRTTVRPCDVDVLVELMVDFLLLVDFVDLGRLIVSVRVLILVDVSGWTDGRREDDFDERTDERREVDVDDRTEERRVDDVVGETCKETVEIVLRMVVVE